MRNTSIRDNPANIEDEGGESDEDGVDFWGRDDPRSAASGQDIAEEDSESSEEESLGSIEEGEDDGDEEDRMDIFGHR
jgi:hypothetical protein